MRTGGAHALLPPPSVLERRPEAVESLLRSEWSRTKPARSCSSSSARLTTEEGLDLSPEQWPPLGGAGGQKSEGCSAESMNMRILLGSALEDIMTKGRVAKRQSVPAVTLPQPQALPQEAVLLEIGAEVEGGEKWPPCLDDLEDKLQKHIPQCSETQRQLFESLLDYISFSVKGLKTAEPTMQAASVDESLSVYIRNVLFPQIRRFSEERAAIQESGGPDLDMLLGNVKSALDRSTSEEDVGGKRRALADLWERGVSALEELSEYTAMKAPEASRTSAHNVGERSVEALNNFISFQQTESSKVSQAQQVLAHAQRKLQEDVKHGNATVQQLAETAARAMQKEGEAKVECRRDLEALVDEFEPKLAKLKRKYEGYLELQDISSETARISSSAEAEWQSRVQGIQSNGDALNKAVRSLEASRHALQSCSEGIQHSLDQISRLRKQDETAQVQLAERWREASARVYGMILPSLVQSNVKTQALVEEFAADRDRIREGLSSALDRLDAVEEKSLKEQLASLEERAREAHGDGERVRERLKRVDNAFQDVITALQSGASGKELSRAEKQIIGIAPDVWAYKIGDTMVQDRAAQEEMFSLQFRQQRLEQMRRSHQREFERIQQLKQRLQSDTHRITSTSSQQTHQHTGIAPAGYLPSPSGENAGILAHKDYAPGHAKGKTDLKHGLRSPTSALSAESANKRRRADLPF